MKTQLADSAERARIASNRPAEFRGQAMEVGIDHSPNFQDDFEALVAIHLPESGSDKRFLVDGTEVRFKYEKAVGPTQVK